MKLLLIAAPILGLALFVLVRALVGRPLSRFVLNVTVALFLLGYVLVTAALGIFWVARMDLPAFDLHYLFGYCVVLLMVVHVGFQLRILATFFRRVSPKVWLVPDGSALRPRVRLSLVGLGFGTIVALFGWFAVSALRRDAPVRIVSDITRTDASVSAPDERKPPELFVLRPGGRVPALQYLHEQSSYSRTGLLRSVGVAPPRPLEVKPYPGKARIVLPAPRPRVGVAFGPPHEATASEGERIVVGAPEMPSLSDVAELCHYAAGVTRRNAAAGLFLRAAASSGALYPVDLYVVARKVRGLESGAYYYEPHEHALVRVSGVVESVPEALVEPNAARGASLAFVAAVTFDRTVVKYNVRSFRYVALDTGHLVANLSLVGSALGFGCRLETAFDDERLGRALSLDPENEGALLVAVCNRPFAPEHDRTRTEPATLPPTLPERADEVELTRLSHRLTSFRLSGEPPRRSVVRPPARSTIDGIVLPPVAPARLDLFETIGTRRSFREFSDTPVRLSDLSAVLGDATRSLPPLRGTRLVDLHLLVKNVAGLEPGAYRYDPERAVLEPRARGDRSSVIQSAALSQEVLGRAAVVLAWTLASNAGAIDGVRDYRVANLEAGLGGELAYLSATARGLGLCGVGAFYDAEVDALLEHGSSRPRTLYLQGLGSR
jgi:SagB-type dehydrogenase family enzyme